MGSATFYESVADLAISLPANRLFLPEIVQEALISCISYAFTAAGGIYLDIPIQAGGDYGDEPENFVSVVATQSQPDSAGGRFFRAVSVDVSFLTARDLPLATAAKLFHGIMLCLQPDALLSDLRTAISAIDSKLTVASLRDAGESQDCSDDGRRFIKSLTIGIGREV